jgi:diacylglycerol kinase family enzyme
MGTLVIVNPNSGRGCAPTVFKKIEKRLFDVFGELFVAVAHGPHEVAEHLDQAAKADVNRLITLGG